MKSTRAKYQDLWDNLVEWAGNNLWDNEDIVAKKRNRFHLMAGNNQLRNAPFIQKIFKVDCCFVGVRGVGP